MNQFAIERGNLLGRVFMGLFATLLVSAVGVFIGGFLPLGLVRVLPIVEIVMIFAAMMMQRRRSIGYGFVFAFTFISGITLYPIIAYYTQAYGGTMVLEALGVTAGAFLIASFVASRTSMDFSFLGGFLFIALIALVLMGIVAMFTGFSTVTSLIYTWIGIAVFVGYILYDVNRIARSGVSEQYVPWIVLSLYLDIINLFLFVLRLMGIFQSSSRR